MKAIEALTILWRLAPETEVKLEYEQPPNFKVYDFEIEKDGANFHATLLDWDDLDRDVRYYLETDGDEKQVLVVQGGNSFPLQPKTLETGYRESGNQPNFIASLPMPIPHLATRGLSDLIWEDVVWSEYRVIEYLNQTYVIWSK